LFSGVKDTVDVCDEIEFGLGEFESLPDFVAELTVTDNFVDVQVDASALHHVGKKTKPQRIRTTFSNTLRELMFKFFDGVVLFPLRQVAVAYFCNKVVKSGAFDDLKWVNYVTSRLTHLVAL
jgi:hypothetical protein